MMNEKVFLWYHLLEADNKLDLADEQRGFEWFASHYLMDVQTGPVKSIWSSSEKEQWKMLIHSLRALVPLMHPRINPDHTSEVDSNIASRQLLNAIKKMTPILIRPNHNHPFSAKTFGGFKLLPKVRDKKNGEPITHDDQRAEKEKFEEVVQQVYYSLVVDKLESICAKCGARLPLTKKKKRLSSSVECKRCRWKKWHDSQTKKDQRARWRNDKRKARKKG